MHKKQKEELNKEFLKMKKLLRPEGMIHDALKQMEKLMVSFYAYLETRFEELEDD